MEAKEVIKNSLREKLKDLSKDELIDIIADMSSVYIMIRAAGAIASFYGSSCTSEVRTDLKSIANSVASTLVDKEKFKSQVGKIDVSFLKEKLSQL